MIGRIALACVFGAGAFLTCLLVGALMNAVGIPLLSVVGTFLIQWATAIAILVALWHFFAGGPNPFRKAG
jgi:hypothetical protein